MEDVTIGNEVMSLGLGTSNLFHVRRAFRVLVAVLVCVCCVRGNWVKAEAAPTGTVSGKQLSGDVKEFELPGGVALKLVKVGKGSFMMGSPEDEVGRFDNETQRRVIMLDDYWLGAYEVTQAQWVAVMGSNPSKFDQGGDYPVEKVSWKDARTFCETLNNMCGDLLPAGYRFGLPTEAQWEYGSRGGRMGGGRAFSGGDEMDDVGWYYENSGDGRLSESSWNPSRLGPNNCRTHPVGGKSPNELGLCDMSGNVYEWCEDEDSAASENDGRVYYVIRGGSWRSGAHRCRSACVSSSHSKARSDCIGFRVALRRVDSSGAFVQDSIAFKAGETQVVTLPGGVTLELVAVEGRYDVSEGEVVQSFWLGKHAVTQAQWEAVMGNNPSRFKAGGDYPVEGVSKEEAHTFCRKLNELCGGALPYGFRIALPTLKQWEYAYRGGGGMEHGAGQNASEAWM